jgi:inositol-phosphate transport system substrate-binding protein
LASRGTWIAVAIIIIVIVVAAGVWAAKRGGKHPATTTTPLPTTTTTTKKGTTTSPTTTTITTTTKTTTTTKIIMRPTGLTGNVEQDIVTIAKYLSSQGIKEVRFSVWGAGDPNSVLREYAIFEAAYRLNNILAQHHVDFKIVIDTKKSLFRRGGGDKLADDFAAAFQSNANPDIMANSFKHLAKFAEQGYILDLTNYIKAYQNLFSDFYPSIMKACMYKGHYYAVPQDTEARPLYWRTDVAACIKEKTGIDILANLAEKIKSGQITWHDVYKYAKLAKETGCSEWGVLHRKGSAHPDLIQFIYAFGGKLEDPSTGKLVFPVDAVYKWLYVEWKMARDGLIPKDMMSWDWAKQIHPAVVSGKTLIWIGGTWHWTEWQTKPYYTDPKTGKNRPLTTEEVKKYFYYTLFPTGDPGGKPLTLSQPFVWYIASNAGKDNPKYGQFKDLYHMIAFLLVVKASDPDIVAIHCIISGHLPVRKAATKLMANETWINELKTLSLPLSPTVKNAIADIVKRTVNPINIQFLVNVSKMLDYTRLTPINPYYPKLADIFADAVNSVLQGTMTPDQAVKYIEDKIKADPDLSANVEIVGTIPSGWKFP